MGYDLYYEIQHILIYCGKGKIFFFFFFVTSHNLSYSFSFDLIRKIFAFLRKKLNYDDTFLFIKLKFWKILLALMRSSRRIFFVVSKATVHNHGTAQNIRTHMLTPFGKPKTKWNFPLPPVPRKNLFNIHLGLYKLCYLPFALQPPFSSWGITAHSIYNNYSSCLF